MNIFRKNVWHFVAYNLVCAILLSCSNPSKTEEPNPTNHQTSTPNSSKGNTDASTLEMIKKVNVAVANIDPTQVPCTEQRKSSPFENAN